MTLLILKKGIHKGASRIDGANPTIGSGTIRNPATLPGTMTHMKGSNTSARGKNKTLNVQ